MSDKIKSLKEEQVNLSPEKELKPYYVKITVEQQKKFETTKNAIAEHKRYTEATAGAARGFCGFVLKNGLEKLTASPEAAKQAANLFKDASLLISEKNVLECLNQHIIGLLENNKLDLVKLVESLEDEELKTLAELVSVRLNKGTETLKDGE
jgi:hypothetical protein